MGDSPKDSITTFDALFTNNHLQILKLMLPYVEPRLQNNLILYIKWKELQYTLELLHKHSYSSPIHPLSLKDPEDLCDQIKCYCTPQEKEILSNFSGTFSSLKNAKEMMENIQMIKEMFPEGFDFGDTGSGTSMNMEDLMKMFM